MSSLRLALKQSLQESGNAGGNKKKRSDRSRGEKSASGKRKKRRGDSPRKRGRPKGSSSSSSRHRPQGSSSPRRRRDSDEEEHNEDHGEHYGHSSSEEENEFSAGEEEEHTDDEEEEEEEGEEEEESDTNSQHDDEEEHKHQSSSKSGGNSNQRSRQEDEDEEGSTHRHSDDHPHDNESEEDDERGERGQHKLQKKLKHTAANKIQSQWKKKKEGSVSGSEFDTVEAEARSQDRHDTEHTSTDVQESKENPEPEKAKAEMDEQPEDGERRKGKKKGKATTERGGGKGKTAKTVPPPEADILEWNRALPLKRARRNVAQGLRVKVRFATKVKREGKILRKKKWFGGRVSAVSKEGSKIRIKYDDGTAEISKFPDKDVVVCDAFNGKHQCDASKFQPPQHEAGSMVMDEERAPTPPKAAEPDKKQSPQPPPQTADAATSEPKETSKTTEAEHKASPRNTSPKTVDAPQPEKVEQREEKMAAVTEPAPKPEAQKPSPVPVPMEEDIIRPPSPPVPAPVAAPPEVSSAPSPPIPEVEMKDSAPQPLATTTTAAAAAIVTKPKSTEAEASKPATPPPPPKVAVSALPAEPHSPGEIVVDEEPTVEKHVEFIVEKKEMGGAIQSVKASIPEQAEGKQAIKTTTLLEKHSSASEATHAIAAAEPDSAAAELPRSEAKNANSSQAVEAKEPRPQPSPANVEESTKSEKKEYEDSAEKDISVSQQKVEPEVPDKPPQARPSLTIRLPNLKKERRVSGNEQKSPRIKISKQMIQELSEADRPGSRPGSRNKHQPFSGKEEPTAKLSGRRSPKGDARDKAGVGLKRRRSEEEFESKADVGGAMEPPTKRPNVQHPAILDEGEAPGMSAVGAGSNVEKDAIVKPKPKRPLSRQRDEATASKDSVVVQAVDDGDGDDGPVKIVGRVSARRVPLFSDEEDEVPSEKPESVLQKPKAKAAKLAPTISTSQEEEAAVQATATTQPYAAQLASDDASAFKSDKEKVLLSSRNSAFDRKDDGERAKAIGNEEAKIVGVGETSGTITEMVAEGDARVPRPTTPMEKDKSTAAALATPIVRSGRRAAQQANERIVSTKQDDKEKDKEKEQGPNMEGKKRKKKERNDEDSESSNEDVNNWVQCASCKKWRIIPNHIHISSLPDNWYCSLNVDPKRNTCDAPEQTARTPVVNNPDKDKKIRKRRKKKRPAEAIEVSAVVGPAAAAVGAVAVEDQKGLNRVDSQQNVVAKEKPRTRSPTPKEGLKSMREKDGSKPKEKEVTRTKETAKSKEITKAKETAKAKDKEAAQQQPTGAKTKPPRASPNSIAVGSAEASSKQADIEPPAKKTKHEKKTRRLPDEPLESIPEVPPPDVKGKRGRKSRKEHKESAKDQDQDQVSGSFHGSVASQPEQDPENVEWVQCDSCSKWRKLPPHISADELPEVWYCKNNTWKPSSASCDAPEDKADGQQDIGPSSPSPSSGKLSYRNLIFGSGRKVNRPVSERTRAAESIFATPSDDSESAYPTVMYANSSVFAPRGSRANIIEDENHHMSVFDLMHHSSLFAELRGSSQPYSSNGIESAGFAKPFLPKFSFETVPGNMRQDMKDLILNSLNDTALLGEEVAQECRSRQWDNGPPSWNEARAYCTKDIVITLLCELVTEGKVQLVQTFGIDWTVKDWNPRYRLANNLPNENAEPPIPKSRNFKIAKPWKLQS